MDAAAAAAGGGPGGGDDDAEGEEGDDEEQWPPKHYDPMAPLLLPLGPRSHAKQVEVRPSPAISYRLPRALFN